MKTKSSSIIASLILLAAMNASAAVYYVAQTGGSDSNPGTESQPWLTISTAAAKMAAGDTVYVKNGLYNEQVKPANSGNSINWIAYKKLSGTNTCYRWNRNCRQLGRAI